jgi:hypothetical protein
MLGSGGLAPQSLISALEWYASRSGRFTPGERPGTHSVSISVGPRADLDVMKRKKFVAAGTRTPAVHSVASRYTD